ncbi:hypothetical protein LTR28_003999 [Elasticomyces elasticus]|nr:hypothetical protein LTR28_003999 [Elasticomyces elasticus]
MPVVDSHDALPAFFIHFSLSHAELVACHRHARALHPSSTVTIHAFPHQGHCSYSLLAHSSSALPITSKLEWSRACNGQTAKRQGSLPRLVQFRAPKHGLDLSITSAASCIYGRLAPATAYTGDVRCSDGGAVLKAYEMVVLSGVPYSSVQPKLASLAADGVRHQERLVRHFARFLANGWHAAVDPDEVRNVADRVGVVGPSLLWRMQQLADQLPTVSLRYTARCTLLKVQAQGLKGLPVVLTHGDIVPSNMIVSWTTEGMSLEGMVDWAEAEWLHFGLGLYGLEHLLGFLHNEPQCGQGTDTKNEEQPASSSPVWVYYDQADALRTMFWTELAKHVPLDLWGHVKEATMLARDVGVLLWYGFAWDEGAINRVVARNSDPIEVEHLEAFLRVGRDSGSEHCEPQ